MISLHLNEKRSIHLINPYQSALLSQAQREGLGFFTKDNSLMPPAKSEDLVVALQLLLLSERVTMVGPTEPRLLEELELKSPIGGFDLSGFTGLGIVELIQQVEPDYTTIRNYQDFYQTNLEFLDEYESFLLAQLGQIDLHFPWYLLRIYIAACSGNFLRISLLEPSIPREHWKVADHLLNWAQQVQRDPCDPDDFAMLQMVDLPIISCAIQLRMAFSFAEAGRAHIAGAALSPEKISPRADAGDVGQQIWKMFLSETAGEQFEIPVPQSLRDVIRLRALPEMEAFRDFVFPFLDSAVTGDAEAFQRLRREVQAVARHLRRLPLVRKSVNIMTYASISLGVVEALHGWIGPSITTGLVGLGLETLAKRWEHKGTWLYLSRFAD